MYLINLMHPIIVFVNTMVLILLASLWISSVDLNNLILPLLCTCSAPYIILKVNFNVCLRNTDCNNSNKKQKKNENILTICVIMANFSPLLIRQKKKILIIIFKACNYFIINKRSFVLHKPTHKTI